MDDKPDFGATTAVNKYAPGLAWLMPFRNYVTPTALWTAISALALAIGYLVHAQISLERHQELITGLKEDRAQDRELLQKIDTQLAVMNSKVDTISDEVDRQREWRERIEDVVAEAPPHARRRH